MFCVDYEFLDIGTVSAVLIRDVWHEVKAESFEWHVHGRLRADLGKVQSPPWFTFLPCSPGGRIAGPLSSIQAVKSCKRDGERINDG